MEEALFKKYKPAEEKVDFEFQALCLHLVKIYGEKNKGLIWSLPYKTWFTEKKCWEALEIAKKRSNKNIRYLIGIIKKL